MGYNYSFTRRRGDRRCCLNKVLCKKAQIETLMPINSQGELMASKGSDQPGTPFKGSCRPGLRECR